MRRWFVLLTIFYLSSILTGCGFHLRDNVNFPKALQTLYISSITPYGRFEQYLKTILSNANITITDNVQQANFVLRIKQHKLTQIINSISVNSQTRSYELEYTVKYDLLYQGKEIIPENTTIQIQNYLSNSAQIGSNSDAQSRSAIENLHHAAAEAIINYLSSTQVKEIIEHTINETKHQSTRKKLR
jgi:LPS-assembly lipoprotein